MVEITDFDSAKAWLETQEHQTQVWFATRCALRAVPGLGFEPVATLDHLVFAGLRAMLISGAASTCPAPEMIVLEQAAARSARSADFAARSASAAAHSASAAAFSAHSASAAAAFSTHSASAAAAFSARSASAARSAASLDASAAGAWPRLWHDAGIPKGFADGWAKLRAHMAADPDTWGFWLRWYERILNGDPLPWELSFQIATDLKEEEWDAGETPEGRLHVARRIGEIEAAWLGEQSGFAEKLRLDDETLQFSAVSNPASKPERLEMLLSRVEDAMDDVVALGGGNGLTQDRIEFRMLARLIRKYSENAERVALDLSEIGKSLNSQIHSGEYPEDAPMKVLQGTIAAGVSEIADMEPEVAESLSRVFAGTPQDPTEDDVLLLTEGMQISAEMMDAATAATTEEDSAEILYGKIIEAGDTLGDDVTYVAVQLRQSVLRRQLSRFCQQYEAWCKDSRLEKHYDSSTFKTHRVVGTYGGIGGVIAAVIGVLAKLIGLY